MASFSPLRPMLRAATSTPLTAAARCAQRSSPFSTSASRAFARLTLVGRLGSDPEISSTSTGQDLIRYTVATSYGPKDNRQTSWFRVTKFVPQEGAQRDYILGIQKGFVFLSLPRSLAFPKKNPLVACFKDTPLSLSLSLEGYTS